MKKEESRPGCPPWEELAARHEGRLEAQDTTRVDKHAEGCVACRTDLAMLNEFVLATPSAEEAPAVNRIAAGLKASRTPKKTRPGWQFLPRWGMALAGMVLVSIVGLQWQARKTTDLSGYQGAETLRSGAVLEGSPREDISAIPAEFAWTSVSGAVSYLIVVSEVDGTELWRGESKNPRLKVPPPVAVSLLPLKTLVWQVTAFDGAGVRLAQSDAMRIRLVKR